MIDDGKAPAAALHELITGYQRSQQLIVAVELGLADLLAGGPRSVAVLADATGTDEDALRRLIRGLAACGLLVVRNDDTVESTPLAALLQSATEGSLRTLALAQRDFYPVWGELGDSVHTGQPRSIASTASPTGPTASSTPKPTSGSTSSWPSTPGPAPQTSSTAAACPAAGPSSTLAEATGHSSRPCSPNTHSCTACSSTSHTS